MKQSVFAAALLVAMTFGVNAETVMVDHLPVNPWKSYNLGKIEGCYVSVTIMSETERTYGIRCPQSFAARDPIAVFNAAGNCTMKRWRVEPLHNHPKHQYRVTCKGPLEEAAKVKQTPTTQPLKIRPNPFHETWIRKDFDRWEIR